MRRLGLHEGKKQADAKEDAGLLKRISQSGWRSLLAAGATALLVGTASAESLRLGLALSPSSMDPHYHTVVQNQGPLSHIFEPLVGQDADGQLQPALATEWEAVTPATWRFKLRPNVKFHDGSEFTAEDVVFSLKRVPLVPNSPSPFTTYTKNIAEVKIIDPLTIEISTNVPEAEFVNGLAQIMIMSHVAASGAAPEGRTTQDLNAGQGLVGTGPYKFVSFTPNDRLVVAAHADYWGGKPAWTDVTMRIITADAARAAALLAGDIDATNLPGESLDALKASQQVKIVTGSTCETVYVIVDQRDQSPLTDGGKEKNPLTDARVREALSVALDRKAISERLLAGLAKPAAELGPPNLFGANATAEPKQQDLDRAKALLAEAGYADGFAMTLLAPNGLFPSDSAIGQAIASMWSRIGVKAQVDALPTSVYYARRKDRAFSAMLGKMCNWNGQMSYSLRVIAMTQDLPNAYGQVNFADYSNPEVDEMVKKALQSTDASAREQLVRQASEIVIQKDYGVLPLLYLDQAYVARSNLNVKPRYDKFLTAMQVQKAD